MSNSDRFMRGGSLLTGNNTCPGQHLTEQERELFLKALKLCQDYGCDFYPTIVQKLTYDEMSEVAAYGGFPRRFPHWKWGMEYEELQKGYELGHHRIYEMVINCQISETLVLSNRGTIRVDQIVVGDKLFVSNAERTVVAIEKQKSSSVFDIKLKDYGLKLSCTPNHKWKVLTDGGWKWKETKDIEIGDLLTGSDNFDIYQNSPYLIDWNIDRVIESTRPNIRHCIRKINPPNKMTRKLAELLGVLVGDGSVGVKGDRNYIKVCVGKDDRLYAEYVAGLFLSVFKINAEIIEKPNCLVVHFASKAAVDFVDKIGLPKGCTFDTKRIPSSIWRSSMEYRARFLRGLFDTDGSSLGGWLSFSAKNPNLTYDVQLMLMEMGIKSRVMTRRNGLNDITVLTIRGQHNLGLFQQRIGFIIERKIKALVELQVPKYTFDPREICPVFITNKVKDFYDNLLINKNRFPGSFWCSQPTRQSVYSLLNRLSCDGYEVPDDLMDWFKIPLYKVESVEDAGKSETYDIALNNACHDYTSNGLITHNTNPCVIYVLNSNTLVDNITVVAHATFHNDFFKNNINFAPTSQNMLNELANHGSRVRRYMDRWGIERVTEFIDHVLRIQTLIDPAKAWDTREVQDPIIRDSREYEFPRRLNVDSEHIHMDPWINTKGWRDKENKRISKKEAARELGIVNMDDKDIFGFVKDYAHVKPWQADILAMLYEEAMYFAPQRMTKVGNEGWASFGDYEIMTRQGHVGLGQKSHDAGIVNYAHHKMGVLGGKYSMNPYKLGFYLLLDIEERWNKGQFGDEWENCNDARKKENWDLNLGLGKQKLFEVRKYYDDVTLISEFFTQAFCDKFEFFEWKHYPNGEYKIENRDAKKIRKKLVQRHINGGLPDIRLVDPNHRGKGWLLLQHVWDGRGLYEPYVRETLASLYYFWNKEIILASRDKNGNEVVVICAGSDADKDIAVVSRSEYENKW